jgi:hypothetical protein
MAQLYMASHPDLPGGVMHEAVTFGSPGAQLTPAPDARIDNIVISDDPAVLLGAHRAEIGALLRADPALAQAAAQEAAAEFPGLTVQDALASLPSFTTDYVNRGDITLLPGANGALGPASLSSISVQEHAATLYLAETEAAAAGTLHTLDVPQQPVTAQQALDRAVYDGDAHSLTAEFLAEQALDIWTQGHGWPSEAHNWLASLHHDLHLL